VVQLMGARSKEVIVVETPYTNTHRNLLGGRRVDRPQLSEGGWVARQ